ncbi:MAG: DUF2147 domain-containing protein [Nevskia sp.]|nr:DUF2147 domain-containing protein [Nevskia sp.]
MKHWQTGLWAGLLAACLVILPVPGWADDPADGILGDWLVESRDAVVRISRAPDGAYEGHIVWQLKDRYGPEDGPEWNGKPTLDRGNPDPALRGRSIDGMLLLWGLRYQPDEQEWDHGHIYDSNDGRTYRCLVHLKDPDHLKLRGYVGISLLGGSTLWTRVSAFPPRPS